MRVRFPEGCNRCGLPGLRLVVRTTVPVLCLLGLSAAPAHGQDGSSASTRRGGTSRYTYAFIDLDF